MEKGHKETEDYRREIIKLVEKINNQEIIRLVYLFAKSGYEEEKAGSE